jgi:hypothetical protein
MSEQAGDLARYIKQMVNTNTGKVELALMVAKQEVGKLGTISVSDEVINYSGTNQETKVTERV